MKKRSTLLFVLVQIFMLASAQDEAKKDSFTIRIVVPAQSVVKNLQLNGDDKFIQVMNLKQPNRVFHGAITDYGMFGLYVDYYDSAKRKMNSTTIPLFIVPGETEVVFGKSNPLIQINGKSAIPRLEWALLNQDDQEYQQQFIDYSGKENSAMESKNREKIVLYQKKMDDVQKKRRDEVYGRFAKKNPNSVVSLYAMIMYSSLGGSPAEAEKLLDGLAPQWQISATMASMRERLEKEKTVMVGAMAPVFTQADTSGKMISLRDFQGKYVFLDFWASWCHPCRAKNPALVKLYKKFKEKSFVMIGISLDMKKGNWTQAIRQDGLGWYQVSDLKFWSNSVAKQYLIDAVPQNVLIDPSGKIIAKNLTEEEADDMLEKLLKG